jgi:hypothetical protein
MKYLRLFPLAVLAVVTACNEAAKTPTSPVDGPDFKPGTGAHFSSLSASIDLTGLDQGDLLVSFRESGLGNSPTPSSVQVEVTAQASAEYACINGGKKHPQAANKEVITAPVAGTGDFAIGNNGSASGTIRVSAPSAGSFSCPPGQDLVLASVTYSTILISDNSNTETAGVQDVPVPPSTLSATFFTF